MLVEFYYVPRIILSEAVIKKEQINI